MITFLAIVHIIACFGLVGLVLIQDSKGGGVFSSQASSTSVLGAGGATSLAQTMTKVVAGIFAITCIVLSIMSARNERSVVDTLPGTPAPVTGVPQSPTEPPAGSPVPAETAAPAASQPALQPGTPAAPANPEKK